jgi:hypothetical protein
MYMNIHKEKRKDAVSQYKHNCICVQNPLHVSAMYSHRHAEHRTIILYYSSYYLRLDFQSDDGYIYSRKMQLVLHTDEVVFVL